MDLDSTLDVTIEFPQVCWMEIISHCRRKLNGKFIGDESAEKKAFGLVAGNKENSRIIVKRCFALKKNARYQLPYSKHMNRILAQHAIPSETELDKRGWVADPQELLDVTGECQEQGLTSLVHTICTGLHGSMMRYAILPPNWMAYLGQEVE